MEEEEKVLQCNSIAMGAYVMERDNTKDNLQLLDRLHAPAARLYNSRDAEIFRQQSNL